MIPNPPETPKEKSWHLLEREDILRQLESSTDQGLPSAEAERRLQEAGPNELAEPEPVTFWQMVWAQLNNFVIYLLIGASLISALFGDYVEAAVIIAIVVLNTVLGVVQERRAEQALSALQKMAAPEAQVIRDGHRQTLPAARLVPGDLVLLEAGNFVPADVRLFETTNLRIDESALTGESVPVEKHMHALAGEDLPLGDRKNMVYAGTAVTYGRGRALVTATGMQTEFGKIAQLLQTIETSKTPLQHNLDKVGTVLARAAFVVVARRLSPTR